MGRYYCTYCDIFLVYDYESSRSEHNKGKKHLENVVRYFQIIYHQQHQQQYHQNAIPMLPIHVIQKGPPIRPPGNPPPLKHPLQMIALPSNNNRK